jgi:acyl-CoA thioesterase
VRALPGCHDADVGAFERETAVASNGDGTWATELSTNWNIGDSANGGYALTPVLRAACEIGGHPDPISVTTHFLRPVQGGGSGRVAAGLVRSGRTVSVAAGTLHQAGADRLVVNVVFGDVGLTDADPDTPSMAPAAPSIPPPDRCIDRTELTQGVDLPIASRVDVRIAPERAVAGASPGAVMEGWIRLADGTPPSTLALPLFADAFPPSLFAKFGRVGWVPTIELTVHARRRPADGWCQARFECDDLSGGRMIETGTLWDSTGRVVARSRQLGLLLTGE